MRQSPDGIRAEWWILTALGLLILPLRWLLAAFTAAVIHELCHIGAVWLCGGWVKGFRMGMGGAVLDAYGLSRKQMVFCSLAGPLGPLLIIPLARWIPCIAVCAAMQSIYNLLPIYPLDGGRALRCFLSVICPPGIGEWICVAVEWIFFLGILCLAIYACFWLHLGILPLVAAIALVVKTKFGKIPCKLCLQGVQ